MNHFLTDGCGYVDNPKSLSFNAPDEKCNLAVMMSGIKKSGDLVICWSGDLELKLRAKLASYEDHLCSLIITLFLRCALCR